MRKGISFLPLQHLRSCSLEPAEENYLIKETGIAMENLEGCI